MTEQQPKRLAVPVEEVRAAVAEYAKEAGYTESWTATNQLAAVLRFDRNAPGREASNAWDKFRGQVRRELDRLAKQGVLVKVGGGEMTPRGQRLGKNESRYYTHERYESDARAAGDFAAEQSALRDHREAICARLRALVIPPQKVGNGHIYLELDHWDILLELAERGAQAMTGTRP